MQTVKWLSQCTSKLATLEWVVVAPTLGPTPSPVLNNMRISLAPLLETSSSTSNATSATSAGTCRMLSRVPTSTSLIVSMVSFGAKVIVC